MANRVFAFRLIDKAHYSTHGLSINIAYKVPKHATQIIFLRWTKRLSSSFIRFGSPERRRRVETIWRSRDFSTVLKFAHLFRTLFECDPKKIVCVCVYVCVLYALLVVSGDENTRNRDRDGVPFTSNVQFWWLRHTDTRYTRAAGTANDKMPGNIKFNGTIRWRCLQQSPMPQSIESIRKEVFSLSFVRQAKGSSNIHQRTTGPGGGRMVRPFYFTHSQVDSDKIHFTWVVSGSYAAWTSIDDVH